jgi:hypothetical protein
MQAYMTLVLHGSVKATGKGDAVDICYASWAGLNSIVNADVLACAGKR